MSMIINPIENPNFSVDFFDILFYLYYLVNGLALLSRMLIFQVLSYVASLLEMTKEEVAELSYQNAIRLFFYRDH